MQYTHTHIINLHRCTLCSITFYKSNRVQIHNFYFLQSCFIAFRFLLFILSFVRSHLLYRVDTFHENHSPI